MLTRKVKRGWFREAFIHLFFSGRGSASPTRSAPDLLKEINTRAIPRERFLRDCDDLAPRPVLERCC
jgi:hypothetical protein